MTANGLNYEPEHEALRKSFADWLDKRVVPHALEWDATGIVPREVFAEAGALGFVGFEIPEEYGGAGVKDFRYNVVLAEEAMSRGLTGFAGGMEMINDILVPYYLAYATEEQRARWLPGMARGETILAIAMTEPGTGSDLAGITTRAVREGEGDEAVYVVNGAKTFISNGINADLIITVVRTDRESRHNGLSLLVIERGMPGFERGRNLEKLGQHGQDTAELSFTDVRVPARNLLGEEGKGFRYLVANLAQERLSVAVFATALARATLGWTLDYVKERKAFGQPIGTFQVPRHMLADMDTELDITRAFLDRCIVQTLDGTLSPVTAAKAKLWTTEMLGRVVDGCVQLHGGYGYMTEYPVARAYADARVMRIAGGTSEIMKEIIGKDLGL
jgi:alkylation response protein AidB-like acyl-CoA dehydrogenase